MLAITAAAVATPLLTVPGAAVAAPTSTLSLDVSRYTAQTNPTQWGHIVEDINHSVEGGLDANLVRNSTMKEGAADPPSSWSAVTGGGGTGSIALDTSVPLTAANPDALRLDVGQDGAGQRVGVANTGFYGVGVAADTTYTATFFARTARYTGPLRVSLEGADGTVYAAASTGATSGDWRQYTVNLSTGRRKPADTSNRVVISVPAGGSGASLWLDVVRVTPPTYGTSGELRSDLMQKLAATRPGFWRVPGGNYLEGQTLATRFDWKKTVGPYEDRPGHQNDAWGYWSTDQAGLRTYLDMAEQSGAEPLLALFAGYTLDGTTVPQDELQPYVQDALDEIQYAIGATDTPWGAQRAKDGHPAPYDVRYVEVGNEDFFDRTGSYDGYRFPMFYDAIKAAYPQLQVVATTPVTTRTPDVVDEHYYNNDPAAFTAMAHHYEGYSRSGPKVLVGEYAITNGTSGNPTGTLSGAIGEAGFMTGMLRNADVVMGASYAPALADVHDFQWPTNLVGFDAATSYGSPSYWVQQMFGANKGRYVLPASLTGTDPSLSVSATRGDDGTVYVHVVNPTTTAVTTQLRVAGASAISTSGTVSTLTGDPDARNSITAPNTVRPTAARSVTTGARFSRTFPASSVTVLTFSVSGAVAPALPVGQPTSLRVTTPGYTDRSVAVSGTQGVTAAVTEQSSDDLRKSATFVVHAGAGRSSCYSLESRLLPGSYLTVTADHTVTAAPLGTTSAALRAATFCPAVGHAGQGVSLESLAQPGRFLRHYANVLYAADASGGSFFDNARSYDVDTTFLLEGGFWRSTVDVPLGNHSFQPTTPGYTDDVLRHFAFVAQVSPVSELDATTRPDATFTVVPGLADTSCYSFRSENYPDRYLRHYDYQVRLDPVGTGTYAQDATFCAQPGHDGQGVSWQAIGFPDRYLRHFQGKVWIASDGGPLPSDAPASWSEDTSWLTVDPLG
ncbi:AbfB domain-containing protein [Lapillicoccus jejuensis]|uniref:AbfB domain-containing protein n=2 Tax=Lapillicoccus jejuensis TaxID=402171 RepID=UPI001152158C|nr:AbfB domain-containing protein [Lapillicoccus jejuensis]